MTTGRAAVTAREDPAGCSPLSPLAPLSALAVRHYDRQLAYHHFGHALAAAEHGARLVELYRRAGLPSDPAVVQAALLYHDAGYTLSPLHRAARTREQVAAQLAEDDLVRLGWPRDARAAVTAAILATEHHAEPERFDRHEQRIVRAADVANLAAPYSVFVQDSENVRSEVETLTGTPIGDRDWRVRTLDTLGAYLCQDLHPRGVSPLLDEATRTFRARAWANVCRYVRAPRAPRSAA